MSNKVLVIAPHPDDEVLGCGGAIARHTACGDEVQVAVISQGALDLYSPEEEAQVRRELAEAHALLGITEVHFLDFPAPKLDTIPSHLLADAIRQTLYSFHPNIVYLPHRGDIHIDHQAVFQATLVAARPFARCPVRKLLCYETLSETEWAPPFGQDAFIPTVFVDITPYLTQKLKAMACYQAELKQSPHPRSLAALEALAQFRGSTISVPAAEAFMLVREIIE
ncbi:PIG-L deacetylase family protein [Geitlerinema calcuttense]|uniref:PIG-L deacetylase family protein n=1 Tax=Geitlerinema calcuttense NRMC-F 0142 TaxID=2922238 RepID=A0ABT7LYH9_9CYAN|nr:PIG-L deacetylase family protein [Geitlerinema calcuttense]MCD8489511.1 PIG-L family deacetylase [Desertifilum sp.]MDI9636400.1 PIG-L deacetylase family protein [Geitlerinema splendidum]MDL5057053.1 PIG-L deacetylase family protein [Geitlerinema calcuttense NRMC-F 0142]